MGELLLHYMEIRDPITARVLLNENDMRSRIRLCKPLVEKSECRPIGAALESLLNVIDDQIRTRRNRLIHDFYDIDFHGGKSVTRVEFTTRIVKQPRDLELSRETPFSVNEYQGAIGAMEHSMQAIAGFLEVVSNAPITERSVDFNAYLHGLDHAVEEAKRLIAL